MRGARRGLGAFLWVAVACTSVLVPATAASADPAVAPPADSSERPEPEPSSTDPYDPLPLQGPASESEGGIPTSPEDVPTPTAPARDVCDDVGLLDVRRQVECLARDGLSNPIGDRFSPTRVINDAITRWFRNLVADALEPILDLLAQTVFSTPDPSSLDRTRGLWRTTALMANSIFVLLLMVGGFIVMSYETVQTRHALKDLLPRFALGWIFANLSLWFVGHSVRLANGLSSIFLSTANLDDATAVTGMKSLGLKALGPAAPLPVVILMLVVLVLAVGLLAAYVLRVATVLVLAAGAPLLLCLYALPQTGGAARLWWRALVGCLAVQTSQAFVLAVAMRVLLDADGQRVAGLPGGSALMDVVVVGALFWLMLRLPTYASRMVFSNGGQGSIAGQAARYVAIHRGVGAIGALGGRGR